MSKLGFGTTKLFLFIPAERKNDRALIIYQECLLWYPDKYLHFGYKLKTVFSIFFFFCGSCVENRLGCKGTPGLYALLMTYQGF